MRKLSLIAAVAAITAFAGVSSASADGVQVLDPTDPWNQECGQIISNSQPRFVGGGCDFVLHTDEWTVGHDIDGWPEPTVQGTCEVSIPGQVDSSGYVVIYDWEGSPDQCDVEPCEDWTGSATPDPDDNYWEGEIVADGNGGHQLVIDDYCVYTGFEDPAVGTATFELDEVATDSWQASADHLIHDPAGFYGIAWWYQTGTFDPISLQIIDDV